MRNPHEALTDLSLRQLLALDALLELESTTRAAERLGLTQSAVSHSLRGLRAVLEDELFVRVGARMIATPRAAAMRVPLRQALQQLDHAVATPARFDAATERRTFSIAMTDSFALTLLPRLLAIVRTEAPSVDLDVRPTAPDRRGGVVERGDADIEFTVGTPDVPTLRSRVVGQIEMACVVREDHPAGVDSLDLDTYCALPHALLSPTGRGRGVVDEVLAELGRTRRVMLRIRFFTAAPALVANSDLVLTGPKRLLEQFADRGLRIFAPPVDIPAVPIRLAWHPARQNDPAHRWLRESCVRAVAGA